MDRRAFLRMTLQGRERVLELSCERLHLRWVDAVARAGFGGTSPTAHPAMGDEGEPSLHVSVPTRTQLLEELERGLAGIDVLRVTGREWLGASEFGQAVGSRIEAFGRRGGRVE